MKVAVLGCGPAGLIAAQAAMHGGADVAVFSRKKKSHLNGAQYLHAPVPGLPEVARTRVDYRLMGDALSYRQKVYGPMWDGTVSAEDLDEEHDAWDIRASYDYLWDFWEPAINDNEVIPASIPALAQQADLVVSSLPAPAMCVRGHAFGAVEAIAAGDAPGLGIRLPYDCPDATVICNGDAHPSWYRLSNIFGHKTVEWPEDIGLVPVQTAAVVKKPTFNNCDCWPEVLRVGRYGCWQKGVLAHEAYATVAQAMDEMRRAA